MPITEFTVGETCTASLHQTGEDGEAYAAPIAIGFYSESQEMWMEQDGHRVQLTGPHIELLIKQLRRARKWAQAAMTSPD